MDIALVGPKSVKLKSKKTSLVVNPATGISKTEAEAVILLGQYEDTNLSKVDGYRIVISGQGEYEVGGTKISAAKEDGGIVCLIDLDGVKVLVGEGKSIGKVYEKIENCNVVVTYTNDEFDSSVLSKIEPNVILLVGDKKEEVAKSLGKDSPEKISKYSSTPDKLPEDLQIYLLA